MKTVRRLLKARIVLAVLAVFVAAGIYVSSLPDSDAIVIGGPSVCVYYNNAKFKTAVGARGTGCCGEVISWGVITPYVRCERLYCLDVQCPF